MKLPLIALLLAGAAWGCKTTTDSALKSETVTPSGDAKSQGAGQLYCAFDSPDGAGAVAEFWSTPGSGALADLKARYNAKKKDGQGQTETVGNVSVMDARTFTKRPIRTYFKSFAAIDFAKMGCYDVGGQKGVGFLCVDKAANAQGQREAAWVTSFGFQQFVDELTVYGTTCSNKG